MVYDADGQPIGTMAMADATHPSQPGLGITIEDGITNKLGEGIHNVENVDVVRHRSGIDQGHSRSRIGGIKPNQAMAPIVGAENTIPKATTDQLIYDTDQPDIVAMASRLKFGG